MYQSLPNKYRPILFDELVGQSHNQKFFKSLIAHGQISRNIVLAGFFGSSKTTTARIYARALLCEHPTEDGEPCNQCESCRKSLEGTHPDIMEIDASSKGGKEDIVNLVEVAKTPPLYSKRRVIIDDEVQAHSRQAWDALLKLIEEPPPFLTFIFCTTEKDKVRPAILSRCAVRDVNLLDSQQSLEHLRHICDKEGFKYEDSALRIISQVSKGHPRDLLKNLEQVSFIGDINFENTKNILSDSQVDFSFAFMLSLHREAQDKIVSDIVSSTLNISGIYEVFKEILLHYKYNIFGNSSIVFNVLFDTVDSTISSELCNALQEISSIKKMSPSEYIDELLKILSESKPYSKSDFIIRSCQLYAYIHSQASESDGKGAGVVSSNGKARRREFVNSYRKVKDTPKPMAEAPIVVEEEITPPQPQTQTSISQTSDRVYAHTLIQNDFEVENMDNLEIVCL